MNVFAKYDSIKTGYAIALQPWTTMYIHICFCGILLDNVTENLL